MKMTRKLSTLVAAAAAVGASTSVVAQQQQSDTRSTDLAAAPSWNTDVLLAAKQCTYCQLSDEDRASVLGLAAISDASIETYAVRGTGPAATNRQYRTSRGIMTVRDVDGYLSFGAAGGPPATNSDTTSRIPTEAEVTRLGQDLAGRMGLPQDEISRVETHGIAAAGKSVLGPVAPVTIARIAEFTRAVNGHRVLESGARFEFGPDGAINRVKIRWPQFRSKPQLSKVRKREAVLVEAAARVGEAKVKRMEIAYKIDDDGFAVPVLLIEAESQQDKVLIPRREMVPLAE